MQNQRIERGANTADHIPPEGKNVKSSKRTSAFRDTLPVMAGYLVLGMGFGILMNANGFSAWHSLAMSVFIYAGSMQYAAIGLFVGGASMLTVALTTLAVNARHLFYGLSMIDKYKNTGLSKPYLIFALTDETYSLVCEGEHSKSYYLTVSLLDQLYWVLGTLSGALIGRTIRMSTEGIDFALTALFLTVFLDGWLNRKDHFPALAGVAGSAACLLIFGRDSFLIPSMIVITALLLSAMRRENAHER